MASRIAACTSAFVCYEILKHILPLNKNIQCVVTTENDSWEEKIYQLCVEHNVCW